VEARCSLLSAIRKSDRITPDKSLGQATLLGADGRPPEDLFLKFAGPIDWRMGSDGQSGSEPERSR
jgi:hypothetical protein